MNDQQKGKVIIMEFLELAKMRCSVRKFKADSIPQDIVEKILDAGHLAPTACNYQPQKVLVVKSAEGLEKLKKCTPCHFDAPLAFIICTDKSLCFNRPFDSKLSADVDASIVTTHMMLEAAELGIGSTWVMFFDPAVVSAEFGLGENVEPIAILPMGYAVPGYEPAPKHSEYRAKEEIVSYV